MNEALNHPQICVKKMRFWCAYSLVSFERKVDSCKKKTGVVGVDGALFCREGIAKSSLRLASSS